MYNASEQFHSAVIADSPEERALLLFDDLFFSNEDIEINAGIKVTENFNLAEELTIGQTPCSQITTKIVNYAGLLSGYNFGEFRALLGVKTDVKAYISSECEAYAWVDATMYVQGFSTAPYLFANGAAVTEQPEFPVYALCIYNENLCAIHANGSATKYVRSGQTWAKDDSFAANDFMQDKWARWAEDKRSLSMQGNIVREFAFIPDAQTLTWGDFSANTWADMAEYAWGDFSNVAADVWEYVPLGTFMSDRPEKVKVDLISLTAKDYMMEFDVEGDAIWSAITYPITLGGIYSALCTYVGVTPASTTFINSTRSFASAPASLEGVTCREILGWIAAAACSIARFNRNGELELAWFSANDIEIPWHFTQNVAEYSVPAIDKLQVKSAENDIGVIVGTGTNAYVILDNPFLYGSSDAEIRGYATPIYDRLSAFAGFAPSNTVVTCDWSVKAGDIVTVNGVAIPIYVQTITWNGACKAIYENTGADGRPVVNAVNRRVYAQNKAMHELVADVNGLSLTLSARTDGLGQALSATKLSFDINGLHIYNGAFDIKNNNGTNVLYADTNGNLTFTGALNGATGSFSGSVTASEGTIGGFKIGQNILSGSNAYLRTVSSTGYGTQVFQSSIAFYKNNFSIWSGQIDCDANYGIRLFSSNNIEVICTNNAYNMQFWVPSTQEVSLTPVVAGTCNIGTNTYFFDYMHANHFTTHSLRASKKNIRALADGDYSFDEITPILYEEKNSNSGQVYLGFIADDLELACKYAVSYDKETGKLSGIDYSRIAVILTRELQKANSRLEQLEEILTPKGA